MCFYSYLSRLRIGLQSLYESSFIIYSYLLTETNSVVTNCDLNGCNWCKVCLWGRKTVNIRPEGEDTQLLHDVKFAGLVKVQDVREQAGIPIKIKLLLLHVIVITHLQHGGGQTGRGKGKVEIMSKKMIKEGRKIQTSLPTCSISSSESHASSFPSLVSGNFFSVLEQRLLFSPPTFTWTRPSSESWWTQLGRFSFTMVT